MELLRADDGCEATKGVMPKPRGRLCGECRAFVTVLGRTEGVLCGSSSCPFPKLNWGEPTALVGPRPEPPTIKIFGGPLS